MKRLRKFAVSFLIYAIIFVQVFGIGGIGINAETETAAATFEDSFDYADFDAMAATGVWDIERVERQDATIPTVEGGVLKMQTKNSVQFKWSEVSGLGEYSSDMSYIFDFDVKVTNSGNGNLWTLEDHTRVLYVAFGGWYNQVEINTKNTALRAGDTYVDYSEDDFLNKTAHVNIILRGDLIISTVKDENGNILSTGERKNSSYKNMNERNGAMKYLVLRCEDGACEIDNFRFSSQNTEVVNDKTIYTCTLTHAEKGFALLSLNGVEIFSLDSETLRACDARVIGKYGAGEYGIKVVTNPVQELMYIDITLPDGGVLRRGTPYQRSLPLLSWTTYDSDVVTNEKTEYESVTKREYDLVTVEPVVSGFGTNVYNLITSFDDARTTRLFAWTAKHSYALSKKWRSNTE